MTTPAIEPAPVDTGDDDPDHITCPHREITWCGLDGSGMPWLATPPPLERVCRVCILAVEMHAEGDPCPVCGCRSCLD